MNIFNFLTKEKHIAGIEISDEYIRISFFQNEKGSRFRKITQKKEELFLVEEPLSGQTISNGIIVNKELLVKTLKNLWSKNGLEKSYAVVSVPEEKVYSNLFSFPKTVTETRFKEAVNLAIDFQLPLKKEEAYTSWENTKNPDNANEALVSAVPRKTANDYIEVLDNAGIKVLALESHISSFVRFVESKPGEITLFKKRNKDDTTIFILKNGILQFSRTLPIVFIKDEKQSKHEIEKIKTSFESKYDKKIEESSFPSATIKEKYQEYLKSVKVNRELSPEWFTVLGAVFRGKIEEGKDNEISLLPVGTAEAYSYQKTAIFIELVRNMIIGVSIFFLCAFTGIYLFIFSLRETANQESSFVSFSSIPKEMFQKEAWIKNLNETTATGKTILSTTPTWDILLEEINSRVTNDVSVSNFSVISVNDPISMTGIAKDRNTLNQLKKSLQTSPYLTSVELPINNLEQKGDIPFTISFRLKDPNMLYYK